MNDARTVLLVDDEISIRLVMAEKLENEGYRVKRAGDGEEALRVFGRCRPWAVVTDYSMPRMNGVELARRIKELAPGIPVILWTSLPPADTTPADYVVTDKDFDEVLRILADLLPAQTST